MTDRNVGSLSRAESFAAALLRVTVGLIFVVHGWAKLTDIPGTAAGFASLGIPEPNVLVYVAIAGEFFGGLGLLFGFVTRVAALGTLCTMLVAIIAAHLPHGLLAKNGGFELPLVLALVSLFFVSYGGGSYSVDALIHGSGQDRRRSERIPSHA